LQKGGEIGKKMETIEVIEKPHIGYWENLGYDNDGWV
jgi:DMSO/TMAO reductase YedYZ molybdopterin-dependent catalytic subunit